MKKLVSLIILLFSFQANSVCQISSSNGSSAAPQNDAHFLILSGLSKCPEDVIEYKNLLLNLGLSSKPTMVANRGRNNPHLGSFSFFEQVTGVLNGTLKVALAEGEFFFGHFTKKINNKIDLDQAKNKGQLLIELIAWDYAKQLFNFYELIGTGGSAKWFYRGDSKDILNDNQLLYRTSTPQFGRTLRCSACHTSGGPIMKELSAPHNDWWTKQRPLTFGNAILSSQIKVTLSNIQDASSLSHAVQAGSFKLQASSAYQQIKSRQSLQEQLRPLFCDTEINIESSPVGFEQNLGILMINSSAFLNPFFGKTNLNFSRAQYNSYLNKYGLKFPENNAADADHPYLVPVKAYSDLLAIQILLKKGLIDQEFMYDVLAIDAQNSLFSSARCELLKLLPNSAMSDWKNQFISKLKTSKMNSAQMLLANLTDPGRNKNWYLKMTQQYIVELQSKGLTDTLFQKLLRDRAAVFASPISKNPLGQILEPGFRVIFPVHEQVLQR